MWCLTNGVCTLHLQEGEVERCKSCELVYHKACFKKMDTCPCGVHLGARSIRSTNDVSAPPNNLVQQGTESKSSIGFLSGLLSKASSSKFWGHKENDTVIPMGSLPSSSRWLISLWNFCLLLSFYQIFWFTDWTFIIWETLVILIIPLIFYCKDWLVYGWKWVKSLFLSLVRFIFGCIVLYL